MDITTIMREVEQESERIHSRFEQLKQLNAAGKLKGRNDKRELRELKAHFGETKRHT